MSQSLLLEPMSLEKKTYAKDVNMSPPQINLPLEKKTYAKDVNMSPPQINLPQKIQGNDSFIIYENQINKLSPNQKEFDDMILSTVNFAQETELAIEKDNEDDEKYFNNPTEYLKDEIMEEEKIEQKYLKNNNISDQSNETTIKYLKSVKARQCQYKRPLILEDDIKWCEIFQNQLLELYPELTNSDINEKYPNLIINSIFMNENEIYRQMSLSKQNENNQKRQGPPNVNNICNIMQYIFRQSTFFNEWKIVSILGSGVFGLVMLVQKGMVQRAIKIMFPSSTGAFMSSVQETELGIKINKNLGIAPKVYETFSIVLPKGNSFGIVQEKLDMNVKKYIRCLIQINDEKLRNVMLSKFLSDMTILFFTLKKCNMTHMDCHAGNVMVKFNRRGLHLQPFLIDFGQFACDVHINMYDVSKFVASIYEDLNNFAKDENNSDLDFIVSNVYNIILIYFTMYCKIVYPNDPYWKTQSIMNPGVIYTILLNTFHFKVHEKGFIGCYNTVWPDLFKKIPNTNNTYKDIIYNESFVIYKTIIKNWTNYIRNNKKKIK
jgi:hypothetical protein